MDEDVTVVACVGKNRSLTLDLQKRVAAAGGGGSKHTTLGSLSVESTNQKLSLTARSCLDSLQELEVSPSVQIIARESTVSAGTRVVFQEEIQYLGSHIQTKLLERIRTLQRLISEFRRQVASPHEDQHKQILLCFYSAPPLALSLSLSAVQRQRVAAGAERRSAGCVPAG